MATELKRTPWRVLVLVLGTVVPFMALAAFFGYLHKQASDRAFVSSLARWKAKGDLLALAGKNGEAHDAYQKVVDLWKDHPIDDPQIRAEVDSVRGSMEKFRTVADADTRESQKRAAKAEFQKRLDAAQKAFDEAVQFNESERTDASGKMVRDRFADMGALWDERLIPYTSLMAEAAKYFPETAREIGLDAWNASDSLETQGIGANTSDLLSGAIYLGKHTHHPHGAKKPSIRTFCYQYQKWRGEGLSHQETIQKMYELKRF
jgi:hypothetical protein